MELVGGSGGALEVGSFGEAVLSARIEDHLVLLAIFLLSHEYVTAAVGTEGESLCGVGGRLSVAAGDGRLALGQRVSDWF